MSVGRREAEPRMVVAATPSSTVLRTVARNLSVMIVAQVVTFALSFIFRAALGRYLGDVGFGKLTFALSVGVLYSTAAGLGLCPLVTKGASRSPGQAGHYLAHGAVLLMCSGILLYAVFCVVVTALKPDPETRLLTYLVGLSVFFNIFVLLLGAIFQAFERMAFVSYGLIVEKLITTMASIGLLTHGFGLVAVGWSMVIASAANLTLSSLLLRKLTRLAPSIDRRFLGPLFAAGLPFFVWAVFTTIYFRIDATMLSLMTTDAVTGWYGVAYALYETLGFLPALLKTVLLPPLSRLYVSDRSEFQRTFQQAFLIYSLITAPIAFGTCALAHSIVAVIYPIDQFANAVPVLGILGIGFIPLFYNIFLATVVVAVDRQRFWSYAAVACALINPAINLMLIPIFQSTTGNGGLGAAWATNAIEMFLLVVGVALMPSGLITRREWAIAGRTLIAGTVMGAVVWWQSPLGLPLDVVAGAAVYLGLCRVLGVVSPRDLREISARFRRRRTAGAVIAW